MKNSKEGIKIVVPKRDTDLAIENITNSNNAISEALLLLASINKALADSLSATNYHVSIEGCTITNTSDTGIGIELKGTDSPETESFDFDEEEVIKIDWFGDEIVATNHADFFAKRQLKPLTRAMVVERAKEYVEKNAKQYNIEVSFVVNEEKRTVVALEKGFKLRNRKFVECVLERGISKCQPDDVFNVHIGKAIALARVLGEDVPDYFLNSPLPEALSDGMKIRSHWSGCIFTVGDDSFLWSLDECDIVDDSDVMNYAVISKK